MCCLRSHCIGYTTWLTLHCLAPHHAAIQHNATQHNTIHCITVHGIILQRAAFHEFALHYIRWQHTIPHAYTPRTTSPDTSAQGALGYFVWHISRFIPTGFPAPEKHDALAAAVKEWPPDAPHRGEAQVSLSVASTGARSRDDADIATDARVASNTAALGAPLYDRCTKLRASFCSPGVSPEYVSDSSGLRYLHNKQSAPVTKLLPFCSWPKSISHQMIGESSISAPRILPLSHSHSAHGYQRGRPTTVGAASARTLRTSRQDDCAATLDLSKYAML